MRIGPSSWGRGTGLGASASATKRVWLSPTKAADVSRGTAPSRSAVDAQRSREAPTRSDGAGQLPRFAGEARATQRPTSARRETAAAAAAARTPSPRRARAPRRPRGAPGRASRRREGAAGRAAGAGATPRRPPEERRRRRVFEHQKDLEVVGPAVGHGEPHRSRRGATPAASQGTMDGPTSRAATRAGADAFAAQRTARRVHRERRDLEAIRRAPRRRYASASAGVPPRRRARPQRRGPAPPPPPPPRRGGGGAQGRIAHTSSTMTQANIAATKAAR